MNSNQKEIAAYIADKCKWSPQREFLGKMPGDRYRSQYYLAALTHNGPMMTKVCAEFEIVLHDANIDINEIQFAGKHWSSLPILGALSYYFQVNTFSLRGERKRYGKHNVIEGIVEKKQVVLVDDLANSSNSFRYCQNYLRKHGIPVNDKCLCILNKKRQDEDGFLWDKFSEQEVLWIVSRCQIPEKKSESI